MSQELVMDHETQKDSKKKAVVAGTLAGALCIGCMAGSLAYFTGTDQVTNEFDIDEGLEDKVTVEEPSWCPEFAKDVVPTQQVAKDPKVLNESTIPAWMFAKVTVPATTVQTVQTDGTPNEDAGTEKPLFILGSGTLTATHELCGVDHNGDAEGLGVQHPKYTVTNFTANSFGTGWTQVGNAVLSADKSTYTYTFKYENIVQPASETPAIFSAVQMANLINATGVSGAHNIVVTGYGVQAEGFATVDQAMAAYGAQNTESAGSEVESPVNNEVQDPFGDQV